MIGWHEHVHITSSFPSASASPILRQTEFQFRVRKPEAGESQTKQNMRKCTESLALSAERNYSSLVNYSDTDHDYIITIYEHVYRTSTRWNSLSCELSNCTSLLVCRSVFPVSRRLSRSFEVNLYVSAKSSARNSLFQIGIDH